MQQGLYEIRYCQWRRIVAHTLQDWIGTCLLFQGLFCAECNVFNVRQLQAKSKVASEIIRDLPFADDCALLTHTHTLQKAQQLLELFALAASCFGLIVSVKQIEVLFQPCCHTHHLL